ncbi:hypothetical protein [Collinsella vaginalis]|uniref:hypothetical protein n=1 Tax=Collinsella vaginalis TaxID=1870987 RepID=UPI000A271F7C|nr:hypothetical protein [Collinsella vaginalis]
MNKAIRFAVVAVAVAAGSFAGYKLVSNPELREKIQSKVSNLFTASKEQLEGMSEDVAMRRAQLTRNPQINRDWVENQWESLNK